MNRKLLLVLIIAAAGFACGAFYFSWRHTDVGPDLRHKAIHDHIIAAQTSEYLRQQARQKVPGKNQ